MFKIGCETTEGTYIEAFFKVFDLEHMLEALINEADAQGINSMMLLLPEWFREE